MEGITVQCFAAVQHGLVTMAQLRGLGYCSRTINRQVEHKRLFSIYRGIYVVGRPELSQYGQWLAAVLSCGHDAFLSHECAGNLWKITKAEPRGINVSVPITARPRRPGVKVYRRKGAIFDHITSHRGIRVTSPSATLVDLASVLNPRQFDAAINEADKLELVGPEQLKRDLSEFAGVPGIGLIKARLEGATLVLTDSELERKFLRLLKASELPKPETGTWIHGFKVDFFWPDLGLIVETDGLRYHRTPIQQARDRSRDQIHTSAGFTVLRFTYAQIAKEQQSVALILNRTMDRLLKGG